MKQQHWGKDQTISQNQTAKKTYFEVTVKVWMFGIHKTKPVRMKYVYSNCIVCNFVVLFTIRPQQENRKFRV